MSTDLFPKITDVSNLKGISFLLALPLLCIAYMFQSGAVVGWGDSEWLIVPAALPKEIQFNWLVLIFIIKSLWISFWGICLYALLGYIHTEINFPVLHVVALLLISFGLFGVFGVKTFPVLSVSSPFWFYASIVWGLFLQSMCEQLDVPST